MSKKKKMTRELVAQEPWGADYLREMDLIIAANEFVYLQTGKTLYNQTLDARVAEFCASLDGGLQDEKLPTVVIPPNDEAPYRRVDEATAFLKDRPRGNWAVFDLDGRFDIYMSDGYGGISQGGHNFGDTSALAPGLTFNAAYASVISYVTYLRRIEIAREILDHTLATAGIEVGRVDADRYYAGHSQKIELTGLLPGYYSGGSDAVTIKATRRGVKPKEYVLPTSSYAQVIGLEPVMPPQYQDDGNDLRLIDEFKNPQKPRPFYGIRIAG